MIPKDFIQVPIERVQDLKPGDKIDVGRGAFYTVNGHDFLRYRTVEQLITCGCPVYRKAEPVQELIEFTVAPDAGLVSGGHKWTSFFGLEGKTFREVTQDSVSRVLTPEQILEGFEEAYASWDWHEVDNKQACLEFFCDGVKFATGCSLLESSEVDLSAKDGSRDVHGGDGRIADALAYIDRQIAEWQDAKGSIVGPYNLDIDAAGTVAIEEFSTIADLLRQGSTRTELATPEPPKEESGSTQSCTQCSTQTEAPLGLIEELERLLDNYARSGLVGVTLNGLIFGARQIITKFKSKPSAEPVKGSATISVEATPKGEVDKPEVAN